MPERIEWEAPEYEFREHHPNWFWGVGIGIGVLVLLAILFKNFLLAIFLIISGFALMMYAVRQPQIIKYALTSRGLERAGKLFLYAELKSFWVNTAEEAPPAGQIIFESQKLLMPHIIAPLAENTESTLVREFLKPQLKEEFHADSVADMLGDYLGF
jgi:hypothetical protein